jgi:hypothetical protein
MSHLNEFLEVHLNAISFLMTGALQYFFEISIIIFFLEILLLLICLQIIMMFEFLKFLCHLNFLRCINSYYTKFFYG